MKLKIMNQNKNIFIDPTRFVSYYIDKDLICINCNTLYNQFKDAEINEILGVPTIFANNFCSRKCLDEFSKQFK
jgi:hypothetical protein